MTATFPSARAHEWSDVTRGRISTLLPSDILSNARYNNHMHRGVATFTLDYGKCPPWLFERMVKLGREMAEVLIAEYGPDEFIKRISDPVWFQSLGTVLAFDWNASGLTTILTAALKEAIKGEEEKLGIFICGGKGKTSRRTPEEIAKWGTRLALPDGSVENLAYNSRMAAKVDSALVQDGFQIYHHSFFFSLRRGSGQAREIGAWAVVQQGMNTEAQTARRYHWFSERVQDIVCEPHTGITSETLVDSVLDLSAKKSGEARSMSVELAGGGYQTLMKDIKILRKHSSELSRMIALKTATGQLSLLELADTEFHTHPVVNEDFGKSKYLEKILFKLSDEKPENYEQLVATQGVGPKTVRALALVGEVIYGARPSYEDPARYSFAHGGKDATPYPVDRKTYDKTIATLKKVVAKTRFSRTEKSRALERLEKHQLAF